MPPLPIEGPAWPLTVQPDWCRFALRPVIGIDPAAVSPWWPQRRLQLCGIRATCPAVDVTNYVMLELGQPMHAHDRTGSAEPSRFARSGEYQVALDGTERKLDTADVLIVDDAAQRRSAVMGGGQCGRLHRCPVEAARRDPAAVSRTSGGADGGPAISGRFGPVRKARRHRRGRLSPTSSTGGVTRRGDDWVTADPDGESMRRTASPGRLSAGHYCQALGPDRRGGRTHDGDT